MLCGKPDLAGGWELKRDRRCRDGVCQDEFEDTSECLGCGLFLYFRTREVFRTPWLAVILRLRLQVWCRNTWEK